MHGDRLHEEGRIWRTENIVLECHARNWRRLLNEGHPCTFMLVERRAIMLSDRLHICKKRLLESSN